MKTWADLKHGDVIKNSNGNKRSVIEVLPGSVLLSNPHEWIYKIDLKIRGWQIVQPEEEDILEREMFFDPNCKKPEVELHHGVWRVRVYRKRSI